MKSNDKYYNVLRSQNFSISTFTHLDDAYCLLDKEEAAVFGGSMLIMHGINVHCTKYLVGDLVLMTLFDASAKGNTFSKAPYTIIACI